MISYPLDYTVEKVLKNNETVEQKLLKKLTGKNFAQTEAKTMWTKIQDHKWLVSEKLGRDIGIRVAAIDYVENI